MKEHGVIMDINKLDLFEEMYQYGTSFYLLDNLEADTIIKKMDFGIFTSENSKLLRKIKRNNYRIVKISDNSMILLPKNAKYINPSIYEINGLLVYIDEKRNYVFDKSRASLIKRNLHLIRKKYLEDKHEKLTISHIVRFLLDINNISL